ncbi:unnamed protein product [Cunninghamella blakesleeana]
MIQLCQLLQKENDIKHIPYVWIDTISIDQQNIVQRKATIHHMDQIYEKASYIVAVPDLHYSYLTNISATKDHIQLIKKHSPYMYHSMMLAYYEDRPHNDDDYNNKMIQYNQQALHDIETKWIYQWLTFDDQYDDDNNNILSSFQINGLSDQQQSLINLISTNIDFTTFIQLPKIPWHEFMMNTTSSSNDLSANMNSNNNNNNNNMDQHQHTYNKGRQYLNAIFQNDTLDDILEQQLYTNDYYLGGYYLNNNNNINNNNIHIEQRRLLKDIQLQKCRQLSKRYEKELQQAYNLLQSFANDWSNRTWVISEYHIAKKKISTPMKLAFLSMDWQSIFDYLDEEQMPLFFWNFFEKSQSTPVKKYNINMNKSDINNNSNNNNDDSDEDDEETLLPATESSEKYYHSPITSSFNTGYQLNQRYNSMNKGWRKMGGIFWKKLNDRLGKRECLDMILNSNATKHQDRFFAILPLWKKYYNRVVTSQMIASWDITDLASVRLNLLKWMDLDDKVCLLHACSTSSRLALPSFVTIYKMDALVIDDLYEFVIDIPTTIQSKVFLKNNNSCLPSTSVACSYASPISHIATEKSSTVTLEYSIPTPTIQLKRNTKKIPYSQYNKITPKIKKNIVPISHSKTYASAPISAPISEPISESIKLETKVPQQNIPTMKKSLPIEVTLPENNNNNTKVSTDDGDDLGIVPNILNITLDDNDKSTPKLLLKVKKYYENENKEILNLFYDKWSSDLTKHNLQWNKDELKLIAIPLFIDTSQTASFSSTWKYIPLIGHPKQNKWVVYRFIYDQSDIGFAQYFNGYIGPFIAESNVSFTIY